MCDGVVLDYILCLVHSTYGGLFVRYNENGNTNNVKVMNHSNMLL
jgi:hypothetical protein